MSSEFQREYLLRLPLPLAQLYGRAHNAKDGRARHDNCFYLFEAIIKLAGCVLIAAYADEIRRGGERNRKLDKLLAQLSLPSLGQWVGSLRELARHFGSRPDAATHPVGHIHEQLTTKRSDLAGMLALFQRIKNGPDGKPAGDKSCSILQLIDALVQYRNTVFGHGASRVESFYENEMGPLLFPALNDVLKEGALDLLGREGSRLVCIGEVRRLSEELVEVGVHELVGVHRERAAPLTLTAEGSGHVLPDRPAILWPGRPTPLMLDPLIVYQEDELAEDVLFLNRDRNGKQVEYLSYSTGKARRDKSMAPDLARLLAILTGKRIDEARFAELQAGNAEEALEGYSQGSEDGSVLSVLGDYEILAQIGRGGMGVVYLVRQLSLGRIVALKMLSPELMKDEVALARFRREIRALGRCDHPNIVKVISTGTMPAGQSYYTMEYVPGADLEQTWMEISDVEGGSSVSDLSSSSFVGAVLNASRRVRQALDVTAGMSSDRTRSSAERPLFDEGLSEGASGESFLDLDMPLPDLDDTQDSELDQVSYTEKIVRLMRDSARALQSIHDQGIIHRDVKPANLVLTPDGERVVLMDFGLAKGSNLTAAATEGGGFLGTLRYAAPEQLASASVQVGPAVDVRGLGVTMWELLTRHKLFVDAEDERQLSQCIYERDVPLLRSIDPAFDRDLEAIVARATERSASDRIQTARELADLLDLYLAGSPLPIRSPGMSELLWRWVRAHRVLVGTSGLASIAVVVTIVVAFVLITQSRNDEHTARVDAEQAEDRAQQALQDATAARADALKHFREARGVVETSLIEVSQALRHFPGMQDVRDRLLMQAAEQFARFASEKTDDPDLLEEAARAQIQLADVRLRVRDLESAVETYRAAEAALLAVEDRLQDRTIEQLDLIAARSGLAQACSLLGKTEEAEAAFTAALDVADRLLADQPDNVQFQRTHAVTLQLHARTLLEVGRREEATRLLTQAQSDYERLARANEAADRVGLAATLNLLSQAQTESGRTMEAVQSVEKAIAIWSPLIDGDPDEPDYLAGRADSRVLLSAALQTLGQETRQIEALRAADTDYGDLVAVLPDIPTYRFNLALSRTNLAQVLNRLGQNPAAKTEAMGALSGLLNLLDRFPLSRQYLAEAAAARTILARVLGELNETQLAVKHFEQAVQEYDELVDAFPEFPHYQEDRAVCRSNLALVLHGMKETDLARTTFQTAIRELDELIALARRDGGQTEPFLMDAQAHACARVGDLFAETGPPIEATKAYVRVLELREQITQDTAHLIKLSGFLAHCRDPQFHDAERALELALLAQKAAPDDPRVWQAIGAAQYRKSDWSKAVEALQTARSKRAYPDCRDGFLLAMALWQSGPDSRVQSGEVLKQSSEALGVNCPGHADSLRLQKEAAELLDSSP